MVLFNGFVEQKVGAEGRKLVLKCVKMLLLDWLPRSPSFPLKNPNCVEW